MSWSPFGAARQELEPSQRAVTGPAAGGAPAPGGSPACAHGGCHRGGRRRCDYVDRRARRCRNGLCTRHRAVVGQASYCPFHADTMRAVGGASAECGLPDIDDVGPALVGLVFSDLHDRMVTLLDGIADHAAGEAVEFDPTVRRLPWATPGTHRWAQGWRLHHHSGGRLAVSVGLGDGADAELLVHIGEESVAHDRSLWIAGTADQAARRRRFYDLLGTLAAAVIAAERAGGRHGDSVSVIPAAG